jgi:hypothetical protein
VPFPTVFLNVGKGRSHTALRSTGVRTRGVELADDADASVRTGFDGGTHAGTTGSHNDNVVLVIMNPVDDLGLFVGR